MFDEGTPMKKGSVVIGGHVQGLGIIRILGRNGIPCFLLDTTEVNIARHSKYCTKFIKIGSDQSLIQFLIKLNNEYKLKDWLLIPTNDNYVQILSKNKKLLGLHYKLSVDDWEVVEKCYNKRITYSITQDLKIDMPKTYFPNNINELENLDLDYPCIIKPAIMHKLYSKTKKKVFLCRDKKELISNYNKILSYISPEEVIVQQIIPGDSDNQYSACFFYDRTKPVVSLVARRKRQYPLDFGNCTTFAETIKEPMLFDHAIKILDNINYWGICEVEFKKDGRDGGFKFLEINPRTWKWHSIANKSDSPFLLSLYNSIYLKEPIVKNDWKTCCWKDMITDSFVLFKLLFDGHMVKLVKQETEYPVFDTDDLKPFLFEILYLPYLFAVR